MGLQRKKRNNLQEYKRIKGKQMFVGAHENDGTERGILPSFASPSLSPLPVCLMVQPSVVTALLPCRPSLWVLFLQLVVVEEWSLRPKKKTNKKINGPIYIDSRFLVTNVWGVHM